MTALPRPAAQKRPDAAANAAPAAPDEARAAAILEEFGTLLRQAVARVCPRDRGIDVADVEQDARIRLWRALKSERPIDDLASYIYRIAATATIDAIRRSSARREDPVPDEADSAEPFASPEPSPEDLAARGMLARAVDTALAGLKRRRRRAVALHLQGLTTREIGDVLGWTEPKARNLVYRGMNDLRDQLRKMGIDDDPR